ncbi:MAG TPA: thioredoxin fold domain-containing protein [Bacteroidota bacterium]|nr:thioredoxin fold domain-containing protein [Bacteroidota bacterium]
MKQFLAAVLLSTMGLTASAEIHFLKGPLAEAITKAKMEKKPVMIDFITDWCRWCDTLDARTYSDASVASFVNDGLIAIKIDAERGEGIEVAKKYGVNAYPTIIFVQPDGEEIDRILGYVAAVPFLQTVKDYVNGVNTIGSLQADLKKNPNDARLHYTLASKYVDRNDPATAAEHFRQLLAFDPKNELGHNEEAQFNVAMATFRADKNATGLIAFMASYPNSDMNRQALYTLWNSYVKAKDGENGKRYFNQYLQKWPNNAGMMNNYAWNCAEQGINLDHAADVAKQAVGLAKKEAEKAGYLDTYATVEFARGNVDEAIRLEQQAIDILKNVPGAKMKEYEASMAKFKTGKKENPVN